MPNMPTMAIRRTLKNLAGLSTAVVPLLMLPMTGMCQGKPAQAEQAPVLLETYKATETREVWVFERKRRCQGEFLFCSLQRHFLS